MKVMWHLREISLKMNSFMYYEMNSLCVQVCKKNEKKPPNSEKECVGTGQLHQFSGGGTGYQYVLKLSVCF